MTRQQPSYSKKALQQWTEHVTHIFPQLRKTQAYNLASWSFAMVLAHACTLTAVALLLTQLVGQKRNSVRQRLREFYQEADAKKGEHRRQLDVRQCFAPLLHWLLRDWPNRPVAVARDASTLGDRFVVTGRW